MGKIASGTAAYFVRQSAFANVDDDMRIAKEEIFGPVMSILSFKSIDEVVKRANDTKHGLAAAVWTRDIKKALTVANGVRAGTAWVNCYNFLDTLSPASGYKQRGNRTRTRRIRIAAIHTGEGSHRKALMTPQIICAPFGIPRSLEG